MSSPLAVTWWGHSSATVELGGLRIGTDPVLVDRIAHLRRRAPSPHADATTVDLVLVSHLHGDHLHVPSLRRMSPDAPIVVPRGAGRLLSTLTDRRVLEVGPGDALEHDGVTIDVLPAHHDGRRGPWSRTEGPALGFRVNDGTRSFWYPGDTGPATEMADVASVDLALVPIGGWGPSLGEHHLGPESAVEALGLVGARWAVPVHFGTFWPIGLSTVHRASHRHFFVSPAPRFAAAVESATLTTVAVLPAHGERVELDGGTP